MSVIGGSLLILQLLLFVGISAGASGEGQERGGGFKYVGYVAPPLDSFLVEYQREERPVDPFELDQKLLRLLESPECWYNQRGRKVLLLFNETNFPEEFVILRKSSDLFPPKDLLESKFLILEEEEEREGYMDLYGQQSDALGGLLPGEAAPESLLEDERARYSYLDSYFKAGRLSLNGTMEEDQQKEKYKARIRKLLRMKESLLRRISQLSIELGNLEHSFIRECDNPECYVCTDFQSHLNSRYTERNRLRQRYGMVLSLLKEFVDHSDRFVLEREIEEELVGAQPGGDFQDWASTRRVLRRRAGYNTTKEQSSEVDLDASYRELKDLLARAENEFKAENGPRPEHESRRVRCTPGTLEALVDEDEKLSALIKGVQFFIESLYERSCPKCEDKSFNGFTDLGEMLDTQLRILKYYQAKKARLEEEIQACEHYLENKPIKLEDTPKPGFEPVWSEVRRLPLNEYTRKLRKIYEQYSNYGKTYFEFEEMMHGKDYPGRKISFRNLECGSNSSVLMNELSKQLVAKIVSNQVRKRVLLKSRACRRCSHNDCSGCKESSKLLSFLEKDLEVQERLFKAISQYLELCNFDTSVAGLGYGSSWTKKAFEDGYFEKDGQLWSIERYSSDSFVRVVLGLKGQVSPFQRAKTLERIKLSLQTLIKVLEFSSFAIRQSGCKYCRHLKCNDCFRRLTQAAENGEMAKRYSKHLETVNLEIEDYLAQVRKNVSREAVTLPKNDWVFIRERDLRRWTQTKPKLALDCGVESYSEAFMYFKEVSARRKTLQSKLEDYFNAIMNHNFSHSEHYFEGLAREWESVWKEKSYNDELFSLLNRYLSACFKNNRKLDRELFRYLNDKSEIRRLNNSFQERSKTINHLLERLRELHSGEVIECFRVPLGNRCDAQESSDQIIQRLNSEFEEIKSIRRRLNNYLYSENLKRVRNGSFQGNEMNSAGRPGAHTGTARCGHRVKQDFLEETYIEFQDILRSPIPGMSKYLEQSKDGLDGLDGDSEEALDMSPKSEFGCSSIEILVLQKLASVLSQNQSRLTLLAELADLKCDIAECFECKVRKAYHELLQRELKALERVLKRTNEQLNQCLLDSEENLVGKQEIIEFQNLLGKLLREKSSFNDDINRGIKKISRSSCEEGKIEYLLSFKKGSVNSLYLWIEGILSGVQSSKNPDEEEVSNYGILTHQVIQSCNLSKSIDDKLQQCIHLLNAAVAHGRI
ncbi:RING/FYVE/PHD-type Zinc finger-containing protein [Cryptosporidium felis]|nr:RING/FYVE/PHD-type Zinc finger-containing protein [Cryptosporidium felis]